MAFSITRAAKAIRRVGRIFKTNRGTTKIFNAGADNAANKAGAYRKGGYVRRRVRRGGRRKKY